MVTKAKPKRGWRPGREATHVVKTKGAREKLKLALAAQLEDIERSSAARDLRSLDDSASTLDAFAVLRNHGVNVSLANEQTADLRDRVVGAVLAILGTHAVQVEDIRNGPRPTHVAAAIREVMDAAEWVRDSSRELLRAVNLGRPRPDEARRDKRVGLAAVVRNLDATTREEIRQTLQAAGVDPGTILDEDLVTQAVNGFAKLGAALDVAIPRLKRRATVNTRKQSRGRPPTAEARRQTTAALEGVFDYHDGARPGDPGRERRRRRFVRIALAAIDVKPPSR